ncbi:receptor-like protein kinase FERONIA [Macadamia integrifolia]|uniref:receptor-like protein kinase FERONIA n=1 Tax=Macadamia integrifolia TaxID=60698 RepID=UPI001C53374E|nr:receptor-like protein kinase FERONIA [Macadamia integrifolia]
MAGSNKGKQNPCLFATLFFTHFSLFSFLLFLTKITTCDAADSNYLSPYHPTEIIVLSCGSTSTTPSLANDLTWISDTASKFGPFPSSTTTTSTASTQDSSVSIIPYMTARLSTSQFNYTFPVSNGMKFIRLHFYPANYSSHDDIANSFFSVTVNNRFTLLQNFNAYLTSLSINTPKFIKEFCVNVEGQKLTLSFTPSPNSFAFINGIEIVSMPTTIYIQGVVVDLPTVGQSSSTTNYINYTTALEMVQRLNVGGNTLSAGADTGMFREWIKDDAFLTSGYGVTPSLPDTKIKYTEATPAYIGPEDVYRSARTMGSDKNVNLNYNLTWSFSVDSGFNYLVRLHFCEFQPEIQKPGDRVFQIIINNQTVEPEADIIQYSGGNGIPVYRDYFVLNDQGGRSGKYDLSVALHPNGDSITINNDAILNGLELFKLSHSDGNLAGPNPEPLVQTPFPPANPSKNPKNSNRRTFLFALAGSSVGFVILFSLLWTFIWCHRRRQRNRMVKDSGTAGEKALTLSSWWGPFIDATTTNNTCSSSLPSDLCRHFSLAEIRAATNDLDQNLLIGVGGFGHVYKGYVGSELTPVAVKRAKLTSSQGSREFQNEIEMLSKLRHLHLVSLIGYCDDAGEMILVYDYMAHGTLRDHLYKSNEPPLSWKQRLNICIGAARGLHYLHTGAKHTIIHRDVKTTNILLDDKWVAKVSDFGLSKAGPTSVLDTHVSTVVKGTLGYLDPEYFLRQQLTEKSDVYSFGVVLFEVLCARPVLDKTLGKEEVSLAEWARSCHRKKKLYKIIDPHLRGKIAPESLERFAELAENCLVDEGIERPSMSDVVWRLEFALQLQETAEKDCGSLTLTPGEESDDEIPLSASFAAGIREDWPGYADSVSGPKRHVFTKSKSGTGSSGQSISSEDPSRVMSGHVFSEIMNPNGR